MVTCAAAALSDQRELRDVSWGTRVQQRSPFHTARVRKRSAHVESGGSRLRIEAGSPRVKKLLFRFQAAQNQGNRNDPGYVCKDANRRTRGTGASDGQKNAERTGEIHCPCFLELRTQRAMWTLQERRFVTDAEIGTRRQKKKKKKKSRVFAKLSQTTPNGSRTEIIGHHPGI